VHEHRRLGVPVRLRADVDARDDDVDLAAVLGELDDPAQRAATQSMFSVPESIEIRRRRQREPLDGHAELLGEVERGDDAPALRLGQRAERARRVAEQRTRAASPRGGARCGCGRARPRCSPGWCRRPVDRDELASVAEVVLAERRRSSTLTISAGCRSPRRRAEMIRCAPSSSGCSGRAWAPPISTRDAAPAGVEHAQHAVGSSPSRCAARSWTISSPRPALMRAKQRRSPAGLRGREVGRRPGVEQQPVPVQALARRAVDWKARIASNAWRTIRSSSAAR
jgi:hypothetical protein